MTCRKSFQILFSLGLGLALGACSFLPGSGFQRDDASPGTKLEGIQIVDVDDAVARQLIGGRACSRKCSPAARTKRSSALAIRWK
jgi:hypothetical protein